MSPELPAERARATIHAFLFGNFVIGTGVLIASGMLDDIASGLAVSVPTAGQLVGVAAMVIAIGAPLLATLTSTVDRRRLLLAAMAIYCVGHAACAFAPGFASLVPARTVAVVGAALFTPQAAATLSLIVPPARRSSALATIFLGWSVASVAGMPLGKLIAGAFGWRAGFVFVAVLSAIALAWVARATPRGLFVPPVSRAAWLTVIRDRRLLTLLMVTLLHSAGQLTLLAYIAPALVAMIGPGGTTIAALLALFGVAGLVGNAWALRNVDRIGADSAAFAGLSLMTAGFVLWGLAAMLGTWTWPLLIAANVCWGLGCFATNSAQQARLVAVAPALASVSVALNTSLMYVGHAVGASLGGATILASGLGSLAWVGTVLLAGAMVVSVRAARLATPPHPAASEG